MEITTHINLAVTIVLDDQPGATAYLQDFPGLVTEGDTPDEAVQNLRPLLERFINTAGMTMSEPMTVAEMEKTLNQLEQ